MTSHMQLSSDCTCQKSNLEYLQNTAFVVDFSVFLDRGGEAVFENGPLTEAERLTLQDDISCVIVSM